MSKHQTPPIILVYEEMIKELRDLCIELWESDASETDSDLVDRYHALIDKTESIGK